MSLEAAFADGTSRHPFPASWRLGSVRKADFHANPWEYFHAITRKFGRIRCRSNQPARCNSLIPLALRAISLPSQRTDLSRWSVPHEAVCHPQTPIPDPLSGCGTCLRRSRFSAGTSTPSTFPRSSFGASCRRRSLLGARGCTRMRIRGADSVGDVAHSAGSPAVEDLLTASAALRCRSSIRSGSRVLLSQSPLLPLTPRVRRRYPVLAQSSLPPLTVGSEGTPYCTSETRSLSATSSTVEPLHRASVAFGRPFPARQISGAHCLHSAGAFIPAPSIGARFPYRVCPSRRLTVDRRSRAGWRTASTRFRRRQPSAVPSDASPRLCDRPARSRF